jgi:signal transduction histidine kinase
MATIAPAPVTSPRRLAPVLLLLVWSIPVVLGAPLTVVSLRGSGAPAEPWRVLLMVGASWYPWAAMTPLIVRLADRHRLERPFKAGTIAVHVAAALGACVVQSLFTAIGSQTLGPPSNATFGQVFVYWLLIVLPAGVVVYGAVVAFRTSQNNRAEALARERQAQQLAAQLSEAQLNALRSQIQPHFLFNTLNAVIALVRDVETDKAVDALMTLGALLRSSLRTGATHEVPLREELAFTTNYLAIERLRFGDRLSVCVDVAESLGDTRVPSFLLQPFVENALRHGVRDQDTGRIEISARSVGDRLVVRVEDDGGGLAPDWEGRAANGFGIANSRARLRQLYGTEATLSITRAPDAARTVVAIELPLRQSVERLAVAPT